jgi:hypothetical protein
VIAFLLRQPAAHVVRLQRCSKCVIMRNPPIIGYYVALFYRNNAHNSIIDNELRYGTSE